MNNSISTGQILFYLLNCAVNQRKPEGLPEDMDVNGLKELSRFHSVSSMVSYALDEGDYLNQEFMSGEMVQFWAMTRIMHMRKRTMFDIERSAIFKFFEENGVWYMPLKGCLLKDMYPDFSMREMADNDILFDPAFRKELRDFMAGRGYEVKLYERSVHDVYLKKPFYNFEFHVDLVDEELSPAAGRYYIGVKDRLLKDADNGYGYHFRDEDFYIYLVVHALKHYRSAGTGIRILSDIYVYLQAKGNQMDWDYVQREMERLGDDALEARLRRIALEVFDPVKTLIDVLPAGEEDLEMLDDLLGSGTYGTLVNRVHLDLDKLRQTDASLSSWTKAKFLLRRLLPDARHMGRYAPFCKRHKWAIPFFWVYRIAKGMLRGGKAILTEVRTVKETE